VPRARRGRGARSGLRERLKRTVSLLLSRDVTVLNNAIAFNFLLCLFPLLLVVVAAAERLAPGSGAANALRQLLAELIPVGGDAFTSSLRQMSKLARGFELLSLGLVVWGSSGIFIPVERVLNLVFGARAERSFWKSRLLAFLLTASAAALALLSLSLTLFGRSLAHVNPFDQQLAAPLARLASWAVKLAAVGLGWALFTLVYRVAPSARVDFGVAARGALWAAVAWEASKYVFVLQLGRWHLQTLYGPLAFAVALVLWAYVSSVVLVFGAGMAAPPSGPRGG
jgi:YihY family inner membrane protein